MIATTKKAHNFLQQPTTEQIDSTKIMQYIRAKRNEVYQTHTPEMLKKENIDTFFGNPQFHDPQQLPLTIKYCRQRILLLQQAHAHSYLT